MAAPPGYNLLHKISKAAIFKFGVYFWCISNLKRLNFRITSKICNVQDIFSIILKFKIYCI